ncbi:hypothetical protein [Aquibacillus salsiterrae]|uniref:Secreted protein n=1 Tax=Aquibacillus salsiterrae TaxID=2950439 RepID=A0A9X3WGK5_9BACI|nr:hypothetical protein [Aquibacillus salsiterrae]MDC3417049.1 hypothetical protein [Aquibacillus salsiterrae]
MRKYVLSIIFTTLLFLGVNLFSNQSYNSYTEEQDPKPWGIVINPPQPNQPVDSDDEDGNANSKENTNTTP